MSNVPSAGYWATGTGEASDVEICATRAIVLAAEEMPRQCRCCCTAALEGPHMSDQHEMTHMSHRQLVDQQALTDLAHDVQHTCIDQHGHIHCTSACTCLGQQIGQFLRLEPARGFDH